MSNFNFEAYRKVFPEVVETPTEVESAVDTFKPTEDALTEKATDNEPGVDENVNSEGEEVNAEEDTAEGVENG